MCTLTRIFTPVKLALCRAAAVAPQHSHFAVCKRAWQVPMPMPVPMPGKCHAWQVPIVPYLRASAWRSFWRRCARCTAPSWRPSPTPARRRPRCYQSCCCRAKRRRRAAFRQNQLQAPQAEVCVCVSVCVCACVHAYIVGCCGCMHSWAHGQYSGGKVP